MLSCGNGWFPKQFEVVKEVDGSAEFVKVVMWWDGMGVVEISAEVVGKAIAGADLISDVGVGYVVVVSKPKIIDKGEESFDEVGEGHAQMVVNEGAPNSKVVLM